ncbi:MAG TPA: flagellar biosynthesis protein FlgI [Gammaproteobacteria bacterium]|nr:flagellar biosynthesis protein FlgI [Gammaproteobacteria bacterium]MEC8009167.1 flagellar basal body P-ring protein FlgI [Pseudomonadota bacterium]HBF08377.1 flagellar biosynthesis protein FlgI [Gammaproteobacteria bacterium]HCK93178.1 flagellar biosynthesis protein FlgI [Gammaproteobacteria bacterium]|tara:strand:- start:651 stop:1763 length:1113 start_codon:yes stop_codon:yes gene_type:complete
MKISFKSLLTVLITGLCMSDMVSAQRLKDLASVQGVRENQLVGYGLVVGLDGTGDQTSQTPFTIQTFKNMMSQFGIQVPDDVTPQLKNVAAVSVHANMSPFMKPGQRLDITVSSIGNAKSLRGGSLLMTPLKGIDGQVYAIAQGNLVVGGFGADGADGSSISVNIKSVGRIPNGALIEREIANPFAMGDSFTFLLNAPDFTTAKRVTDAINRLIGPETAYALDAGSIKVTAPRDPSRRVNYLSVLENLQVTPGEEGAKVIINSRTGTIVMGQNVRVSPTAISHGNLTVTIKENQAVIQPDPLAAGDTAVQQDTDITITQEDARMFVLDPGVNLQDVVNAINEVGVAPGDLMAILEALKQAGALHAELVVI